MKKWLSFLLFLPSLSAFAQGFIMDDTTKLIYKPTNSSTPPHENFQFINLSGDSLAVRWRVNTDSTYYPAAWTLALQDNETYHHPIIDSNDVIIPDSAGTMDKIIINVYHNATPGYGRLVIDLINLDSVQEIHTITFLIEIYQAHQNTIEENAIFPLKIYPNPATDIISLEENEYSIRFIQITDINGKKWFEIKPISAPSDNINIRDLPSGIYFIRAQTDQNKVLQSQFIKH